MQRTFTRDVGKYVKGETRDWPMVTWKGIADNHECEVDDFSTPTVEPPVDRSKRPAKTKH